MELQQQVYPILIYMSEYPKKFVKIRVDLGVLQASSNLGQIEAKIQGGHCFGNIFVMAITFYHLFIFRNRFRC